MIKSKIKTISIVILLLIGYFFLNSIINLSIPCLFHKITDFYCPGCGLTRMIFSIFKLDFYQAFRYNPMLYILLILFLINLIIKLIFKKYYIIFNQKTNTILLIIVIIFGIARNIPAFYYLAPTII